MFKSAASCALSASLLAAIPGTVWGQAAAPNDRTGGILVGDLTLDTVYLVRDADGDGVADSATVFFGAGNESGIAAPTGTVFAIFQAADRTVYISDGDNDAVYAVRDNNADGDAMDAGEARVWIRGGLFNFLNFTIETPNGLAGSAGAIFIANAGIGTFGQDAIYRTIDLNGDGDADDENECSIWFDALANVPNSNPFDLCFVNDTAYFADLRGSTADAIISLRDGDASGQVGPDEFGFFLLDGDQGAACDLSCITDGTDLFVHNQTGVQSVYRLRDIDSSGTIDAAGESTMIWTEAALPPGSVLQTSFAIAHGPIAPVTTMAISSHGTAAQDAIYLLRDFSGDGDFLDDGETTAFITGVAEDGVFPENIRSMCFYAPVCRGDFDRSGQKGVPDIFAFLSAWFAGSPEADVDGVPGVTVPDIFAFLSIWFGPC